MQKAWGVRLHNILVLVDKRGPVDLGLILGCLNACLRCQGALGTLRLDEGFCALSIPDHVAISPLVPRLPEKLSWKESNS